MIPSASVTGRRRVLVAVLVVSLIVAGSAVVTLVTRNGGFRAAPALAQGTILEVEGGPAGRISVAGDNIEVVVGSSPSLTSASIVVGSEGFHRDFRAQAGTLGLRLDKAPDLQTGARRLTIVVPENGTLTLTLVGAARVVLDQARLGGSFWPVRRLHSNWTPRNPGPLSTLFGLRTSLVASPRFVSAIWTWRTSSLATLLAAMTSTFRDRWTGTVMSHSAPPWETAPCVSPAIQECNFLSAASWAGSCRRESWPRIASHFSILLQPAAPTGSLS